MGLPNNQIRSRGSIEQAEHEDLAHARRVLIVDGNGNAIDENNRLPVDAAISVTGGSFEAAVSTTPQIVNFTATLADTEYSLMLPANTRQFHMRARTFATTQVSFTASESNVAFYTIRPGCTWQEQELKLTSKTIYFRVSKPNTVIELLVWL